MPAAVMPRIQFLEDQQYPDGKDPRGTLMVSLPEMVTLKRFVEVFNSLRESLPNYKVTVSAMAECDKETTDERIV